MRSWTRLGRVDRALLLVLLPLWAVCFALHLERQSAGRVAWLPMSVTPAASAEGHPQVADLWASPPPTDLQPGDRLLRVGDVDLRGAGRLEVMAAALESADAELRVPVAAERAGRLVEGHLQLSSVAVAWRIPFASAVFTLLGALLLWRAPNARASRPTFLALLAYSLNWTMFSGGSLAQTTAAVVVSIGFGALIWPFALRALRELPEDLAPARGGRALWPWLFAPLGAVGLLAFVLGTPLSTRVGERATQALNAAGIVAACLVAARGYRRSGAIGRRQIRWIVYGIFVGLGPPLAVLPVLLARPDLRWLYDASQLAAFAIPVGVAIAIVRYNLFDIDRMISATAAYSLLGIVLLAAALTAIPWLSGLLSERIGIAAGGTQVALSVALAALLVPLQQRLRPEIERLFFAERHALAEGIQQLLDELARARDARELAETAGTRLDRLLRPETLAIYVRSAAEFALAFVRGSGVPPSFPAESPFVAALAARSRACGPEAYRAGEPGLSLGAFERAALESLGSPALVPVRRGGDMLGFVCLGPKRSGDVYTATDLALLGAVADRVSGELLRFDYEQLARDSLTLQASLRSYVPTAVVDQLTQGQVQAGEREVSVLFVDIRGYSSYAEGARAEEVFRTVSRYTETVSAIVREHGGSVVDFSGDGLMAVFGAPRALPAKERAAVEAGRSIVDAVAKIAVSGRERLSVGVGIATGPAFVGNVRSADRLIWAVIGRTTNLAARLQALTRERSGSIVVDDATASRASDAVRGFERQTDVIIRGHREPRDLWMLSLGG